MSWRGAVGLSLKSRVCPAADSTNKILHAGRCAEEPLSELSTSFLERVQTSQHQHLIIAVRKYYHHRPSLYRLQRLRLSCHET